MGVIEDKSEYLKNYKGKRINLMEVCGTHTAAIFKSGIRQFLSSDIRLISGPGCPVCVTGASFIDNCLILTKKENCVVFSFGDMLKVAGSSGDSLSQALATGSNVKIMYSPFEILEKAEKYPDMTFVIAAVGFETTAPVYALLLRELISKNIKNVKLLTALKMTIPAIEWILDSEEGITGLLLPGHVASMTGENGFRNIAKKFPDIPMVIGGFGERHVLNAVHRLVHMTEIKEKSNLVNLYSEAVSEQGNALAMKSLSEYFSRENSYWRGIGRLCDSGLVLKADFREFDAVYTLLGSDFLDDYDEQLPISCSCREVIVGRKNPDECSMFRNGCSPEKPYGPCMVSSEGACSIWYQML